MNSVEKIKDILIKKNLKLSVGESCTGGLISSILTDIDGASKFIEVNFVTYSKFAKIRFLDVPEFVIERYGVVSNETAYCMATGLLQYSGVSIATTGYVGPTGGDEKNPIGTVYYVGTVYYAFGYKNKVKVLKYISEKTDRKEIKQDMANFILDGFVGFLEELFN